MVYNGNVFVFPIFHYSYFLFCLIPNISLTKSMCIMWYSDINTNLITCSSSFPHIASTCQPVEIEAPLNWITWAQCKLPLLEYYIKKTKLLRFFIAYCNAYTLLLISVHWSLSLNSSYSYQIFLNQVNVLFFFFFEIHFSDLSCVMTFNDYLSYLQAIHNSSSLVL